MKKKYNNMRILVVKGASLSINSFGTIYLFDIIYIHPANLNNIILSVVINDSIHALRIFSRLNCLANKTF